MNEIGDQPQPWEEIIAKAVHDMRSPLSSLRTSIEILRLIVADPEKSAVVIGMLDKQVDELSRQMERLVTDPGSFRRVAPAAL